METRLKVESAGHCLSKNCKNSRRKRFVLQESTVRVQGCECYCQLKGKSRATGIWTQVREKSFFMVLFTVSSPWWSAVVAEIMIENLFHRRFARIQWSSVSRSVRVWRGVIEWWGAFLLVIISISDLVKELRKSIVLHASVTGVVQFSRNPKNKQSLIIHSFLWWQIKIRNKK